MKIIKLIAIIMIIAIFSGSLAEAAKKKDQQEKYPLYGLVLVIDPGHGGTDPGARKKVNGKWINEDEYCYDIALRLRRAAKKNGAIVFMTIKDRKQLRPFANKPRQIIRSDRRERFSWDRRIVRAGISGLVKRVKYANKIKRKYPRHKVVFISIHFDVLNKKHEGVRIVQSASGTRLGPLLAKAFKRAKRIKMKYHLLKSGDKAHGIKRVYVLSNGKKIKGKKKRRGGNKIREKVLVELGNFRNPKDLWRIRAYKTRESYAQSMTRALIQLMKR